MLSGILAPFMVFGSVKFSWMNNFEGNLKLKSL